MKKIQIIEDDPVIFLTARDTPEDELLAFGVGGDDFIRKPYNSAVLLARIELMFAVTNLCYSDRVNALADVYPDIGTMFNFVTGLACLVTALVLSYATGFMLKLRRKEFGMYLTLGITRGNIQRIFACETGIISFFALLVGMGAGLVIFQFLVALFASVMEMPVTMSAYSMQGIILTVAVSIGLFLLSTLASMKH